MDCKCPEGWPIEKRLVPVATDHDGYVIELKETLVVRVTSGYRVLGHTGDCSLNDEVFIGKLRLIPAEVKA